MSTSPSTTGIGSSGTTGRGSTPSGSMSNPGSSVDMSGPDAGSRPTGVTNPGSSVDMSGPDAGSRPAEAAGLPIC